MNMLLGVPQQPLRKTAAATGQGLLGRLSEPTSSSQLRRTKLTSSSQHLTWCGCASNALVTLKGRDTMMTKP
jgi:hypothetical protein